MGFDQVDDRIAAEAGPLMAACRGDPSAELEPSGRVVEHHVARRRRPEPPRLVPVRVAEGEHAGDRGRVPGDVGVGPPVGRPRRLQEDRPGREPIAAIAS